MRTSLLVFLLACQAAVIGQTPTPPARPTLELGLALGRLNNGTDGFTPAELKTRMIGFAAADQHGEYAIAYSEDRGDNQIHPPLHLAASAKGKRWVRATLSQPAAAIEAVVSLFIGRDYLLANTGTAAATRQIVVFSKDLAYVRSTGGAIAIAPLANDTVVFSETRNPLAQALRSTYALFDVHSGSVTPIYPGTTPAEPSPAYRKLLTRLVADLNREIPQGNSGRGYREDWYAALTIARPEYDAVRDVLTFKMTFAPTWPLPASPKLSSQVETFEVTCGPMLKPARRCIEGPRTIAPLNTGRGRR